MSTEAVQMCCDIQPFLKIIKLVISLIQWTVPLVLIVLGTVDMFKAIASGDEKVVKDSQSTFIKRLIYGVLIFLVPFFVRLILNFVNDNLIHDGSDLAGANSWIDCWNGTLSCSGSSTNTGNNGNLGNNNTQSGNAGNSSSLGKKTCYTYILKKFSCDSGLTNSCLSSGNCDSSDYCEYRFKFDKTQYERLETYGNDYFSKNKIQICKNFLNVGLKSTKCDDVLYEDYDSKNGICICQSKINVSNEIKYTSNYSSIPNINVTLSKYSCSNEVSCDGVDFTVSGLCTKVN